MSLQRHSLDRHDEAEKSTHEDEDNFIGTSEDTIQKKRQRIHDLETEISNLEQAASYLKLPDGTSTRTQVFYHILDNEVESHMIADSNSDSSDDSDADGDDNGDGRTYLFEPEWVVKDNQISLKARSHILDPKAYVERIGNTGFIIFKVYNAKYQLSAVNKAIKKNAPLPRPTPMSQNILLVSNDMIGAINAYFDQYPRFRSEYPEVIVEKQIRSPYVWWYHSRSSDYHLGLRPQQAQLVKLVTDWIESNYAPSYKKVNNQLKRGRVSRWSLQYLIRPGQVVVSYHDGKAQGHIARGCPHTMKRKAGQKWTIKTESVSYAGSFYWLVKNMDLEFEAGKREININDLNVVPLEYATSEVRTTLEQRGSSWWKSRGRRLVSYQWNSENTTATGQRFMIDFHTYEELHPQNHYSLTMKGHDKATVSPFNAAEPSATELYVFPPRIPGFDLRLKKWSDLDIDQVCDVDWNDQAFNNLVADEDTKEFILALVTNQLADERGTDLIENKGNGLILLLHGPPGTGKTFTAESVAEIARKPLYTVTCGDIGTRPEEVEKYLESVFYLGKLWDCVVLLDEAEVFLEQRTLQDLHRNALVSVFLRALEYYSGILILTTNRVGTFDEAFKSRVQLALRYEKLDRSQRKQIWKNFFARLENLGEQDEIDFDDIETHIDELADFEMNGRQIRNTITTARQVAKYKQKKMRFAHLERAIKLAKKFDDYLAEVREAEPDESDDKRKNGRYSDDYFARIDQVR
ncbi:hypothetical protein F5B18DRAFT_646814 [Nemania serpens]|nr:hypothetical protein F5B18DRAFT_646814 [Nemania serpens]